MTATAYPLSWPMGWPRTASDSRKYGRFATKERRPGQSWTHSQDITIAQAVKRIDDELHAFDGPGRFWRRIDPDNTVISTNLELRNDGLPRSAQREPADPGAVLYFTLDGKQQCVPCDSYSHVAQNLAAIAASLAALRALERHGSGLMERAFTGFTALPPPMVTEPPWWEVLQVPAHTPTDEVRAAYKRARSAAHPDRPEGSHETFLRVQTAWDSFCKERGLSE